MPKISYAIPPTVTTGTLAGGAGTTPRQLPTDGTWGPKPAGVSEERWQQMIASAEAAGMTPADMLAGKPNKGLLSGPGSFRPGESPALRGTASPQPQYANDIPAAQPYVGAIGQGTAGTPGRETGYASNPNADQAAAGALQSQQRAQYFNSPAWGQVQTARKLGMLSPSQNAQSIDIRANPYSPIYAGAADQFATGVGKQMQQQLQPLRAAEQERKQAKYARNVANFQFRQQNPMNSGMTDAQIRATQGRAGLANEGTPLSQLRAGYSPVAPPSNEVASGIPTQQQMLAPFMAAGMDYTQANHYASQGIKSPEELAQMRARAAIPSAGISGRGGALYQTPTYSLAQQAQQIAARGGTPYRTGMYVR